MGSTSAARIADATTASASGASRAVGNGALRRGGVKAARPNNKTSCRSRQALVVKAAGAPHPMHHVFHYHHSAPTLCPLAPLSRNHVDDVVDPQTGRTGLHARLFTRPQRSLPRSLSVRHARRCRAATDCVDDDSVATAAAQGRTAGWRAWRPRRPSRRWRCRRRCA
jgi:hypothetical protein